MVARTWGSGNKGSWGGRKQGEHYPPPSGHSLAGHPASHTPGTLFVPSPGDSAKNQLPEPGSLPLQPGLHTCATARGVHLSIWASLWGQRPHRCGTPSAREHARPCWSSTHSPLLWSGDCWEAVCPVMALSACRHLPTGEEPQGSGPGPIPSLEMLALPLG